MKGLVKGVEFPTAGSGAGSEGPGTVPAAAAAVGAMGRDPDRAASDSGRDQDWACDYGRQAARPIVMTGGFRAHL
ncbi:MAG: hypothetical protein AB7G68_12060 [Nitrospiraceae bacterium]